MCVPFTLRFPKQHFLPAVSFILVGTSDIEEKMSRTESKKIAMTDRAQAETQPGETLLHCVYEGASGYGGCLFWFFGIPPVILGVLAMVEGSFTAGAICFAVTAAFILMGSRRNSAYANNHYFVTDRRLCFRRKNLFGMTKNMDIPIEDIMSASVEYAEIDTSEALTPSKRAVMRGLNVKSEPIKGHYVLIKLENKKNVKLRPPKSELDHLMPALQAAINARNNGLDAMKESERLKREPPKEA